MVVDERLMPKVVVMLDLLDTAAGLLSRDRSGEVARCFSCARRHLTTIMQDPAGVLNQTAARLVDVVYSAEELLPNVVGMRLARNTVHDIACLVCCRTTNPYDVSGLNQCFAEAFGRQVVEPLHSRLGNARGHLFGEAPPGEPPPPNRSRRRRPRRERPAQGRVDQGQDHREATVAPGLVDRGEATASASSTSTATGQGPIDLLDHWKRICSGIRRLDAANNPVVVRIIQALYLEEQPEPVQARASTSRFPARSEEMPLHSHLCCECGLYDPGGRTDSSGIFWEDSLSQ